MYEHWAIKKSICGLYTYIPHNGPITRYVKLRIAHAPGMPGTFPHHRLQMKPLVNDSSMHHGTCVMHHDDVIKWKHFPRNWPFVREIHRSPVNFPHKCQWRGALMFSLIYAWINDWVNNREAGDLRRQLGHYDVIVMCYVMHVVIANPQWRGKCSGIPGACTTRNFT